MSSIWLTSGWQGVFDVSLDCVNWFVQGSNVGTVQGSILGPLFSLCGALTWPCQIMLFADDNYVFVGIKIEGNLSMNSQPNWQWSFNGLKIWG